MNPLLVAARPRLLTLAAGLAAAATSASAQYTRTDPPRRAVFRLGPVQLNPKLELRNAGKDDNVFVDSTNPVSDTSIVLRGSVEGFVPVRSRLRLYGEAWLDWSYFRTYDTERSTDPGGEGRAEFDIGPFTLVGGGGALQARQLFSTDIDERTLRQEKWVYAGAEWRIARLWSLSAGAEERSYRYDPRLTTAGGNPFTAASLNRNNRTFRAEARYSLTPLTRAVGQADVIEDEFQLSSPGLSTTRSYRYLGGFEFGEKAFLTGRVLVGLRDFPADSSGSLPSYRGPAALAEVVLPFRGTGRLTGSVQRDIFISATPVRTAEERGRNTYRLTSLKGGIDYGLPLSLVGRLSAGFDEASYLLPYTIGGVPYPRIDHLYTCSLALLRTFSDSFRAGGSATYYRRVSTIPGQSYERWVYGISAELVP
jgi:hypothetical protein